MTAERPPTRSTVPSGHVGITDPPPVPLHGPLTCDQHGPTVTVTWSAGDRCPLCESHEAERRIRTALADAASSLGRLSKAGARDGNDMLSDLVDVRGYATNRAKAAWVALEDP